MYLQFADKLLSLARPFGFAQGRLSPPAPDGSG